MKEMNLSLAQKAIVLVSIPLLFEIAFVATLGILLSQAEYEREQEAHAKAVAYKVNELFYNIIQLGSTLVINEYFKFNEKETVEQRMDQFSERARLDFIALKKLVRGHEDEERAVKEIEETHKNIRDTLRDARLAKDAGNPLAAGRELMKFRKHVAMLTTSVQSLTARQKEIEIKRGRAQARARQWITLDLLIGMVFNIFLALSLAFHFNRGTAARLEILMDNTRRLARGLPLNPAIGGTDEIAHLDKVFNEMARALAEAARKERAIITNARDVICSMDAAGKFTAVNPAVENAWGYAPDELIGRHWTELVLAEDHHRTAEDIARIKSGETSAPIENRVRRKDHTQVDILWSAHWSEPEASFFLVAHDITDRKEMERMKRDFLAMVSHDLRTPLTSIQSFLSLMGIGAYGTLNQHGAENLAFADSAASRVIKLITDLLDMERLESGKFELDLDEVSIDEIISESVSATRGYAEQQKVMLEAHQCGLRAVGDADRLIQVLINLISNAVKFSPKDGRIAVRASQTADAVEIRVADQGRGVPDEYKGAVFERFRQVKTTDARKLRGSGLGLAICKAIVERHGGSIGLEDADGGGTIFWFRIPGTPPP